MRLRIDEAADALYIQFDEAPIVSRKRSATA